MDNSVIVGAASKSYYKNKDYVAIWEKAKELNVEKLFLDLRKMEMLISSVEESAKNVIRMVICCEPIITYEDPHMRHLDYSLRHYGTKKLNKCLKKNNATRVWYDAGTTLIFVKNDNGD